MNAEHEENISGSVLFVDDEENILRSFKRVFFQTGLRVLTARSAQEGLKILMDEDINVVISDYRMPGMDGLQFLKMVQKENPQAYRVILSGQVDHSMVLKALNTGLALAYLAKPWGNEELRERIIHIIKTIKRLNTKKLMSLLNSIQEFPACPSPYRELLAAIETEKPPAEIGDIIEKDPTVTIKVLHIANSAFYGNSQVSSIKEALDRVGPSTIKEILLAGTTIDSWHWNEETLDHFRQIFLHSAMLNRYLPAFFRLRHRKELDNAFQAAGITHDIGKIIILSHFPDRYRMIVRNQENSGISFYKSEIDLGFEDSTHAEIGGYFLDYWGLPEPLVEIALFHHSEEKASESYQDAVRATSYTDKFVNYIWQSSNNETIDISEFLLPYCSRDDIYDIAHKMKVEMDKYYLKLKTGKG